MPNIFDNIKNPLLPELVQTLQHAYRADFSVGYFNLRGWRELDERIEAWAGDEEAQCRLLVGMHQRPQDDLRELYRFRKPLGQRIDYDIKYWKKEELFDGDK